MAGTLTLYSGVELNNKYNDVFESKELLEKYLDGKEVATYTNLPIYFKLNGNIKLGFTAVDSVPNYMKFEDDKGARYFFIHSYEVFNNVVNVEYVLDIWHTYKGNFKTRWGHRVLDSYLGYNTGVTYTPPLSMIPDGIGQIENKSTTSTYGIILIGYRYKGEKETSGTPSDAESFFGMVTDKDPDTSINATLKSFTYVKALYQAEEIIKEVAAYSSNSYYATITNAYIIPDDIFIQNGVTPYYYFGAHVGSITIDSSTYFYMFSGPNTVSRTTTFAGIKKPISGTTSYTGYSAVGTLFHKIPVPYSIYNSTQGISVTTYISTNQLSILMHVYGQVVDITNDFAYDINFTPEQALTAEQRKNNGTQAAVQEGASAAAGIVKGIGQIFYNPVKAVSTFINTAGGIASTAIALSKKESSVSSAAVSSSLSNIYNGICYQTYSVLNYNEIVNSVRQCGYMVDYYEDSYTLDASASYTVVMYDDINVYGNLSETEKLVIEEIFHKGVRIWNQSNFGSVTYPKGPAEA